MTQQELGTAIFAANDIALQWYAATHHTAIPGQAGSVVIQRPATGGLSATFGSGTLVLAAIALVGVIILLKD